MPNASAPPLRDLLPGQLWEITVPYRRRPEHTPFGEAPDVLGRYYVTVVDGRRWGWTESKWGGMYISKPIIGDTQRPQDALWEDLYKLRDQNPPYVKNYVRTLDKYRGRPIFWERQIEWR